MEKMESDFTKNRRMELKIHRNIAIAEIIIYIAAILLLFGYGGRLEELSSVRVPLLSFDGIVKICAIICFLILVGIVSIPGLLIVGRDILAYYEYRKSF